MWSESDGSGAFKVLNCVDVALCVGGAGNVNGTSGPMRSSGVFAEVGAQPSWFAGGENGGSGAAGVGHHGYAMQGGVPQNIGHPLRAECGQVGDDDGQA